MGLDADKKPGKASSVALPSIQWFLHSFCVPEQHTVMCQGHALGTCFRWCTHPSSQTATLALTPRAQVPYSPHPHPPLMPPGLPIGWPCSHKTCKLTEFRFVLVWDCSYWSKEAPSMQYITKFHTLFQDFKMFCHLMESTWITPGHWKS